MKPEFKRHYSAEDIGHLDRIFRLRMINTVSGYKSASLIGTMDPDGNTNLGTFNSVVHIGSSPPLLGFVMRPSTVPRHTLSNILKTGHYTINLISEAMIEQAHYCSANFDKTVSEFEACGLTEWYDQSVKAPYVQESPVRLGMSLREKLDIASNGTSFIVGEVKQVHFDGDFLTQEGDVDLEKAKVVTISGLNHYHRVKKMSSFPYARVEDVPKFNTK